MKQSALTRSVKSAVFIALYTLSPSFSHAVVQEEPGNHQSNAVKSRKFLCQNQLALHQQWQGWMQSLNAEAPNPIENHEIVLDAIKAKFAQLKENIQRTEQPAAIIHASTIQTWVYEKMCGYWLMYLMGRKTPLNRKNSETLASALPHLPKEKISSRSVSFADILSQGSNASLLSEASEDDASETGLTVFSQNKKLMFQAIGADLATMAQELDQAILAQKSTPV